MRRAFFATVLPFEMLRETVLPELIARRQQGAAAANMERGEFDGAGGLQRGDAAAREFSGGWRSGM